MAFQTDAFQTETSVPTFGAFQELGAGVSFGPINDTWTDSGQPVRDLAMSPSVYQMASDSLPHGVRSATRYGLLVGGDRPYTLRQEPS